MMEPFISASCAGSAGLALARAALLGFMVGTLLGAAHFSSLWWNVRLFAKGGAARAFGVQLLRFGLLIIVLVALARTGATALLAGMLGAGAARSLIVRRLGRVP